MSRAAGLNHASNRQRPISLASLSAIDRAARRKFPAAHSLLTVSPCSGSPGPSRRWRRCFSVCGPGSGSFVPCASGASLAGGRTWDKRAWGSFAGQGWPIFGELGSSSLVSFAACLLS